MNSTQPNPIQSLSQELGKKIAEKLRDNQEKLKAEWNKDEPFRYFFLDNILDEDFVLQITQNLPQLDTLLLRSSLRERKRVGVDFFNQHPSLQSSLYAFQEPEVIKEISQITGLKDLEGDPSLYASGISVMGQGDFLNPHIDNSHDGEQKVYRVLNLLFYVSSDWTSERGGNFEVWDWPRKKRTEIVSKFNRLVVMETHDYSWHSVNQVKSDHLRCCVSNYFFSPNPTRGDKQYRHVTTFGGRPEQPLNQRLVLKVDGLARNLIGKIFPSLLKNHKHRIQKQTSEPSHSETNPL
jgi:Rps23 Pro-64 3,4-dihydroxylase Tpa1-like proline 4-hydroxylase